MQFHAQEFLKLAEEAGKLCFLDIEATGTKGDYNSCLVISIKPYHEKAISFTVETPGDDRALVTKARDFLEQYPLWVTFYGKGFDIPFIRTRLVQHNCRDLVLKHHIDMYYVIKASTLTARRSQAHLLEFLDAPMKKLTLSPDVWNKVLANPKKGLGILVKRCERDVAGLEALYDRTKRFIREITR